MLSAVLVHLDLVHLLLPHFLDVQQAFLVLRRVEDFVKLI